MNMAAFKPATSTFSRSVGVGSNATVQSAGLKIGPNGTMLLSSGIPDLDAIVGGGFATGSLVVIIEDPEAPHHMLLIRNFMAQGLVHHQPLLYASPADDPKGFLGTLPKPVSSKDDKPAIRETVQDEGLRIAWQYKKYSVEHDSESRKDGKPEYSSVFDLRKPMERHLVIGSHVDCISLRSSADLAAFKDRCSSSVSTTPRDASNAAGGRIAVQSLCSPHCEFLQEELEILSCVGSLKRFTRLSNSVAVLTFSPSLVSASFSKRMQHLADTLISVKAIPDEDKELAKLLTGYQDMVGLLSVHKVARINTQVPVVMEATTFSIKLHKRRYLTLESLSQAPVDGSSGSSYASASCCSGSSSKGSFDF